MKKTTLRQAALKLAIVALAMLSPLGLRAQETLTVNDGTATNGYIPFYGYYMDTPGNTSEFIIPADQLGDMEGGTISKLTFYLSGSFASWGSPTVQIYLGEVEGTTLSSTYGPTNFTVVYTGTVSNQTNPMVIEFDDPYVYEGGNLLIGTYVQVAGSYKTTNFYGVSATSGSSINSYEGWSGVTTAPQLFLPKTTFEYEPAATGGDVCEKPATCEYSNLTATSATLSWTGGSGTYNVELKAAGDAEWTTVLSGTTLTTTTLTLQPTTSYQARVQSVCDGSTPTSGWKTSTSFSTPCGETTLPYFYGFEDASPLACWTMTDCASSTGRYQGTANTDSYCFRFYYGYNDQFLISPELSGTGNGVYFSFYYRQYSNGTETFHVGYSTTTNSTDAFTWGDEMTATTSYQLYENVFPAGTKYVAIKLTSYDQYYLYIDDVNLTLPPTCYMPTAAQVDEYDQTTATISWVRDTRNADGETYSILMVREGDDDLLLTTSTTPAVSISGSTASLTGLTQSTPYSFKVVTNCANTEENVDFVPLSFTTLANCPAPTATLTDNSVTAHGATIQWNDMGSTGYNVRYQVSNSITVDFESGSLPDGWTANTSSTSSGVQSNQGRNNSYGFRFHYSENGATLVSPVLSGTENGVSFSFYYKRYSDDYTEGFKVGYNTDGSDEFTYGDEISVTNTSSWLQYENTFPAGTKRIAIQYVYHNAYYLHIDDIDITIPNDNWTTVNNITATNYPITGLTADTRYLVQVQSVCGEDVSSWSESVSFTTEVACVAPTYLAKVGDEEARQVALTWNENGANTSWQIDTGDVDHLISVNDPDDATHDAEWHVSYTLTGLDPDREYTVKVRSNCGDEGFSQWSNAITIHTTPSCYKPTAAQVDGYDQTTATISWTRDDRNDAGETYSIWMVPGGDDDPYVLNSTTNPAVTVDNDNHTASLTGLTQNTPYTFWVGTTCANTDESVEVVPVNFTTLADCPIPVLEASGITDVTAHTANVAWTGNDQNNSYTVSYRTAATTNTNNGGIKEDFNSLTTANSIPEGWSNEEGTTTTASYKWCYVTSGSGNGATNGTSHDNSNCVRFNSYGNSENNTNFLQTPSMDFPAGETMVLSFWWKNPAAGDFSVYISTDGGTTKTPIAEGLTGQSSWTQSTYELADYIGATNVTIHFKGTSNWGSGNAYIYLDDVKVGYDVPAGDWQTNNVTINEETAQITGLTAETTYEVKVEGNCANDVVSDPSDIQSFTTFAGNVAPTIGEVTDITTTSAIVSWTGAASNTLHNAFELYYSSTEAEPPVDVTNTTPGFVGGVTSPYTLQGLTPATNYKVWVRDYCGTDGTSAWAGPLTFTTECAAINLGDVDYSEDFDDITLASSYSPSSRTLPTCWSYINTSTYASNAVYPTMYYYSSTDYSHSSPNSLRFYSTYSSYSSYDPQDVYAILPEMEHMEGKQITLWARGYNASSTFKIGMMDDPTDATTFHEIAEQALTTSYAEYSFILADGNYVAIMMEAANSTTNTKGVYIDDITIADAPTCVKPSDPTFVSATTTTATLSWTNGADGQNAWQIAYSTDADFNPVEVTPVDVHDNPGTIDGLTPATTYYAYVRANCGNDDYSDWSAAYVQFATKCEAVSEFPWNEDFESYNASSSGVTFAAPCWVNEHISGSGSYFFEVYSGTNGTNATKQLRLHDMSNNTMTKLMLPEMTLPGDDYLFSIDVYRVSATSYTGEGVRVYASTDGEIEGAHELAFISRNYSTGDDNLIPAESAAGWYTYELPIGFSGTCYIILRGESKYGSHTYMDNFAVKQIPTCTKPTELEFVSATTTTATLSWTAGGNETSWDIYYSTTNEAPTTQTGTNTSDNPATIEGLTASTTYYVWVRAHCTNEDQSDWIGGISFATKCEATVVDADNPFFEGFEGTTFPPTCWSVGEPYNNGYSSSNWTRSSSTSNANTGSGSAYSGYYGPIYLYTPTLHIDGVRASLSFSSYNTYASSYDQNSVLISVDGGANWTELWSPATVSQSHVTTPIDLTAYAGQDIQLCFKYEGSNAHGWYLDDVKLFIPTAVEKTIEANKWYAISSPVNNSDLARQTLEGVTNLTTGTYDLFGYTESAGTWNAPSFLEQGKGYIYRHADAAARTLTFVGVANSGPSITTPVTTSCLDDDLKGFNLVGNPYPHEYSYSGDYYSLNTNGTWAAHTSGTIGVAEGFLVKVSAAGTVDFTEGASSKSSYSAPALAFTVSNEEFEDVAYARFDNGEGLPKIGHLNSEAPMLSIPVDGRRYAIANLSDDCQSFNLVFRGTGTYTIKQSSNQAIAYCHLIDRATGKDIDLLSQSYTFSATGNDADRFMVKLSPDAIEDINGHFAYWNGHNWVVEGDGELQVYDMLGRRIASHEVNSQLSLRNSQFPSTGVYVLRMGEKSQKIVVR